MSKRKYMVRAECPQCACGDVSFLWPEKLREKFIGDEKEIEILCPFCGTKHKGKLQEEIVEKDWERENDMTKTEQNLLEAFAGESRGRTKP